MASSSNANLMQQSYGTNSNMYSTKWWESQNLNMNKHDMKYLLNLPKIFNSTGISSHIFHLLFDGNVGDKFGGTIYSSLDYFNKTLTLFKRTLGTDNELINNCTKEINDYFHTEKTCAIYQLDQLICTDIRDYFLINLKEQKYIFDIDGCKKMQYLHNNLKILTQQNNSDEQIQNNIFKILNKINAKDQFAYYDNKKSTMRLSSRNILELFIAVYSEVLSIPIHKSGIIPVSIIESLEKKFSYEYKYNTKIKRKAHAICFSYNFIEDTNKYEVLLFNSGSGADLHNNDSSRDSFTTNPLKWTVDKQTLHTLYVFSMVVSNLIHIDIKQFYSYLYLILPNKTLYDTISITMQLSGSCTFYSIYYTINYKLHDELFSAYDKYIRKIAYSAIYKYLSDENNTITEPWKNILDIISNQQGFNKFKLYSLYKKYAHHISTNEIINFKSIASKDLEYIRCAIHYNNDSINIHSDPKNNNLIEHLEYINNSFLQNNGSKHSLYMGNILQNNRYDSICTNYGTYINGVIVIEKLNNLLNDKYYENEYNINHLLRALLEIHISLNELERCQGIDYSDNLMDTQIGNNKIKSEDDKDDDNICKLTRSTCDDYLRRRLNITHEYTHETIFIKLTSILLKINDKYKMMQPSNKNNLTENDLNDYITNNFFGSGKCNKDELYKIVSFSDILFGSLDKSIGITAVTTNDIDFTTTFMFINSSVNGTPYTDYKDFVADFDKTENTQNNITEDDHNVSNLKPFSHNSTTKLYNSSNTNINKKTDLFGSSVGESMGNKTNEPSSAADISTGNKTSLHDFNYDDIFVPFNMSTANPFDDINDYGDFNDFNDFDSDDPFGPPSSKKGSNYSDKNMKDKHYIYYLVLLLLSYPVKYKLVCEPKYEISVIDKDIIIESNIKDNKLQVCYDNKISTKKSISIVNKCSSNSLLEQRVYQINEPGLLKKMHYNFPNPIKSVDKKIYKGHNEILYVFIDAIKNKSYDALHRYLLTLDLSLLYFGSTYEHSEYEDKVYVNKIFKSDISKKLEQYFNIDHNKHDSDIRMISPNMSFLNTGLIGSAKQYLETNLSISYIIELDKKNVVKNIVIQHLIMLVLFYNLLSSEDVELFKQFLKATYENHLNDKNKKLCIFYGMVYISISGDLSVLDHLSLLDYSESYMDRMYNMYDMSLDYSELYENKSNEVSIEPNIYMPIILNTLSVNNNLIKFYNKVKIFGSSENVKQLIKLFNAIYPDIGIETCQVNKNEKTLNINDKYEILMYDNAIGKQKEIYFSTHIFIKDLSTKEILYKGYPKLDKENFTIYYSKTENIFKYKHNGVLFTNIVGSDKMTLHKRIKDHLNIYVFINDTDPNNILYLVKSHYYIDNNGVKQYTSFEINNLTKSLVYTANGITYKIITDKFNPMYSIWTYGIPTAFIVNDGGVHKLLVLLTYATNKVFISNIWKKTNDRSDNEFNWENSYFLLNISYNGLTVSSSNNVNLKNYSTYCNYVQKEMQCYTLLNYSSITNYNNPYKLFYTDDKKLSLHPNAHKYILPKHRIGAEYNAETELNKQYIPYSNGIFKIFEKAKIFIHEQKNPNQLNNNSDKNDLNLYINSRTNLKLNASVIQNYKNLTQEITKFIYDIEQKLIYYRVIEKKHMISYIMKNAKELYVYMELKNLLSFIENDLHKNDEDASRREYNKKFNFDFILMEPRNDFAVVITEILFGNYMWKKQYDVYESIFTDINKVINGERINYSVHQLLMGNGKSEFITPAIIFKYIYGEFTDKQNVLLVLPHHLITQSYNTMKNIYKSGLENVDFNVCDAIERLNDSNSINRNLFEKTGSYFSYRPMVRIIDDTNLKMFLLNFKRFEETQKSRKIIEFIKNNVIFIMDEFDSLFDPLSSDLNYPFVTQKLKSNNPIGMKVIIFFLDFINHIVSKNRYVPKEYIHSNVYDIFKEYVRFIRDDSNLLYKVVKDMIQNIDNKTDIKSMYEHYYLYRTVHKFYLIVEQTLNVKYNKGYGFPHKNTHENLFIAVPYSASDTPVLKSTFSDLDITIVSTILAQLYSKIRFIDVKKIIQHVKKIYDDTKMFLPDVEIMKLFMWFSYLNLTSAKDIERIDITDKNVIESFTNDINKSQFIVELKMLYLKDIIIPNIEFTAKLYNCSFIDVMSSSFTKLKCGFSGTVSINLPYYDSSMLLAQSNKIQEELQYLIGGSNTINEYTEIKYNSLDNGEIHAALLGIFNKHFTASYPIIPFDTGDKIIEKIIEYMYSTETKIECLIDAGAFFSNYSIEYVIKSIATLIHNEYHIEWKEYIYIDSNDIKRLLTNKNGVITIQEYDGKIHPDAFIFYDNKHIVGIDIKQPAKMLGLVTINKFNKYTDISQAIFRMRNLNEGHEINFCYNKDIPSIRQREDIYNFIWKQERIHLHTVYEQKKLLQNLKYLNRINDPVPKNYTENALISYNEYKRIHDEIDINDQYKYVLGDEEVLFIDNNWCKTSDILTINTCEKLKLVIKNNNSMHITNKYSTHGINSTQHEIALEEDVAVEQTVDVVKKRNIDILIELIINVEKQYEGLNCDDMKISTQKEYTINDYLNFSNIFKFTKDSYDINKKGIYISPQFFKSVDILFSHNEQDFNKYLKIMKKINNTYNGYEYPYFNNTLDAFLLKSMKGYLLTDIGGNYIIKDGKYLLLTKYESRMVLNGLKHMSSSEVPILELIDSNNNILFTNKLPSSDKHTMEPIEFYVQYLLGNNYNKTNLIKLLKYIGENNHDKKLTDFVKCTELIMDLYRDKNTFYLILQDNSYEILINTLNELTNIELLEKLVNTEIYYNNINKEILEFIDNFVNEIRSILEIPTSVSVLETVLAKKTSQPLSQLPSSSSSELTSLVGLSSSASTSPEHEFASFSFPVPPAPSASKLQSSTGLEGGLFNIKQKKAHIRKYKLI